MGFKISLDMMEADIDKLILNYLRGELTKEEETLLDRWLDANPANRSQLKSLSDIWETPLGYPGLVNMEDEQHKIWRRVHNENKAVKSAIPTRTSSLRNAWKYAAILLLVMGFGYFFWMETNTVSGEAPAVAIKVERTNPLGQKSKIHLPDGSTVYLNAGSRITYLSDFNNNSRKLSLEGEAYFEVAKNPDIPFEVHTDGVVVTAVGTSFNVNAFVSKNIESIALNTGKVKIERIDVDGSQAVPSYLVPGDMAFFNHQSGTIELSDYKGMDPFGWKDGRIVFHHASFDQVLETLSRWYNVEFTVEGSLRQKWNYSSTFENEVLENVLESLKFSENIDYSINGSTIKITL